jgi:hypothetical protein
MLFHRQGEHGTLKVWLSASSDKTLPTIKYIEGLITWRPRICMEPREIGEVSIQIVDKKQQDSEGHLAWLSDTKEKSLSKKPELSCIISALVALYDEEGDCLPCVQAFDEDIDRDTLIYISEFRLNSAYQRHGLGSKAFRLLHETIPTCLRYLKVSENALLLLRPDCLNKGDNGEQLWFGNPIPKFRADTQARLRQFYGRNGYEVWFQEDNVQTAKKKGTWMLMGRALNITNNAAGAAASPKHDGPRSAVTSPELKRCATATTGTGYADSMSVLSTTAATVK